MDKARQGIKETFVALSAPGDPRAELFLEDRRGHTLRDPSLLNTTDGASIFSPREQALLAGKKPTAEDFETVRRLSMSSQYAVIFISFFLFHSVQQLCWTNIPHLLSYSESVVESITLTFNEPGQSPLRIYVAGATIKCILERRERRLALRFEFTSSAKKSFDQQGGTGSVIGCF